MENIFFDNLLNINIQSGWIKILQKCKNQVWFSELNDKLKNADWNMVLPKKEDIFKSLTFFEPQETKVVILGQDPYIHRQQATGLAFAVPNFVKKPPSLVNIFKEILNDYNNVFADSDLLSWAKQKVLLLNTTLTVQENKPASHYHWPWKELVRFLLKEMLLVNQNCIFLIWGKNAENAIQGLNIKFKLVTSHPSPLSYTMGFKNCHHFVKANNWLKSKNFSCILW